MNHVDLLHTPLKSEFLCDLFETYDTTVTYGYDRTHENLPDEYHAEVPELGLQFIFDDSQCLRTLFIKPVLVESFNPLAPLEESIVLFPSKADALSHANTNGIDSTAGQANFMGEVRDWIRFEYPKHSVHYEFVNSGLRLITLRAKNG